MVVEVLWSFRLSERIASSTASFRLFAGSPGGRPYARLRVGTPREAPTPEPMTKTLVPTTVNRRSTRAEVTRRAPTLKIMAWRVKLRRPRSPESTPRFDVPPEQRSWSRNLPLVAIVCLLVGCLTFQQQANVSQGRICSDKFTCCHTEIEVADQTFYFNQSQYTDTGPTSPSADPITPGAGQGSHWSVNF